MAAASSDLPDVLPVLPLRDRVALPLEVLAISVRDETAMRMVDEAMRTNRKLALVASHSAGEGAPPWRSVGTAATIQRLERTDDGAVRLLLHAEQRIAVGEPVQKEPYPTVRVTPRPEVLDPGGAELEAVAHAVRNLFVELNGGAPAAIATVMRDLGKDPAQLVYVVATNMQFSTEERLVILEMDPLMAKLRHVLDLLQHERTVRELGRTIDEETREQLTKAQRQQILREQLRTIERELGMEEGPAELGRQLREQAERAGLPPEAAREAEREIARLERLPESSPEHGMLRTYIEWMVNLPWSRTTSQPIDLSRARQALDEDHDDLKKVKERIVEHLAVKKLRHERGVDMSLTGAGEAHHAAVAGPLPPPPEDRGRREPILCFVGPPGVGKTSLGESIARAMQRNFVRISLGGIHDESEIRGHRRTYIGAMPGRFIQALRRAGVADPVFMLDEVDKLGVGFHGDPSAALLEVLDPAQNRTFVDTYLGVAFDLSRVFFICTANATDPIPPALQDRMEIIQLSGYSEEEKLRIARRHLLPRLITAHGLRPEEVEIDDGAIARLIRDYTREAGVRTLERVLSEVLRKVARNIGEGQPTPVVVRADAVRALIGPPRVHRDAAEQIDRPGIAMGLAWTPVGGEVLFVEAAAAPERGGKLLLTGMLGEVMRESAETALSYLLSNAALFGVPAGVFGGKTVHVHVPAGAIPKDGPSAGVAILTALASLATGRTARPNVAMTGEITLRGKVLPVGGIPEKVLAAYRVGVSTIILPRANADALEDVPEEVRTKLRFEWVDSADQALRIALPAAAEPVEQPAPAPAP